MPRRMTNDAAELLAKVDAGGVPAFVTGHLYGILIKNGVKPAFGATPNQLIEELRKLRQPKRHWWEVW